VVQVNEPQRYADAPSARAAQLRHPIYLTELRRDQHQTVQQQFGYLGFPTQVQTRSGGLYMLYPARNPKSSIIGKMP